MSTKKHHALCRFARPNAVVARRVAWGQQAAAPEQHRGVVPIEIHLISPRRDTCGAFCDLTTRIVMAGAGGGNLSTLLATLPAARSPVGRAVLDHLAAVRGQIGSAQFFARRIGLDSRHQLHRRLLHDGLPPVDTLAAWVRILSWVTEAEKTGRSLYDITVRAALDPPTCYRTVTRITHEHWSTVCRNGSAWVLLRLIDECRSVSPEEKKAVEERAS